MREIKVMVLTAMHERYDVSRLFCLGLHRLFKDAPAYIKPTACAVVSDATSHLICVANGIHPIICENRPLGRKWNTGMEFALRFDWDYVIILGDDDLLSSTIWKDFEPFFERREDYFGLRNEYFYHPKTGQALYFEYNKSNTAPNKIIGGGRVISRRVVEQTGWVHKVVFAAPFDYGFMNYERGDTAIINDRFAQYLKGMKKVEVLYDRFFSFWKDYLEKGLDNNNEMSLLMNGFHPVVVPTLPPVLIDVKTDTNVWKFDTFEDEGRISSEEEALWFLSNAEIDYMKQKLQ